MPPRTVGRRTVLRAIGVGSAVVTASAGSGRPSHSTPSAAATPVRRFDTYHATVDRIVGGTHVVLLLEEDGRVVDQVVVRAEDYPTIEEGDAVVVALEGGEPVAIRRATDCDPNLPGAGARSDRNGRFRSRSYSPQKHGPTRI